VPGLDAALHRLLLTEQPPAARIAALPSYRWLVVGTVCVGAFLGQLDASIATLVLPTLEVVFKAQVAAVEWVAIAYLVTLAALVVTFGRLADIRGRKLLYNAGFVVFILGSALCGLAPHLGLLIAFRVLQAVGAAMLQANSVAIITAAVPRHELGRAIGIQGAAQAVGLSVGPSVGGFLIAALGWQWVFYIAVQFGLAGAAMAWFILPQTERDSSVALIKESFDWWGAALFAAAVAITLLAVTFGNSWGWTSARLAAAVFLAVAALAMFIQLERKTPRPLLDFELFRNRLFSAGIVSGLMSYAVLFGMLFLMPFYLQRVRGHDPVTTGLLLTAVPLAIVVLAPLSGALTDRVGSRWPTVLGMGIAALALSALALPGAATAPPGTTVRTLVVFGVGLGLFTPPNNSAIMGSAPRTRLGLAAGVLNMTRSLGTSLGVAATGAVLALTISSVSGRTVAGTLDVPLPALLVGFRRSLLFLAILAVAAGAISLLRGRAPTSTSPQAQIDSIGV
ncbi:MAG TPA: MFS transporter, partial [Chloroflexota bacterium]|nr:MFS transporter [Chloroflexota bacterium]